MIFDEMYKQSKKADENKEAKKKLSAVIDETRDFNLYTYLNDLVFNKLEFTDENSTINVKCESMLKDYYKKNEKLKYPLNGIADNFSIITRHVKLSDLTAPYILYDEDQILFLSHFVKLYDQFNSDKLATQLCDKEVIKDGEFKYSFSFSDYILKNELIQEACSAHKHYLAGFEIVKNSAETKKAKELVYDFKFHVITNKEPIKIANEEPVENPCEKRPQCNCHDDGIPVDPKYVKILEVKDLDDLPKSLLNIIREITE
ncbi:MAG: hypothetical protein SPK28_06515 [Bacilli bacterium]|nr:hypothetical protein [Bacilli bacterium]